MSGRELTQDYVQGGRQLFRSPGTIFTIKREALVLSGGFHRAAELGPLLGIVPFGDTGFDETAVFYWRRHEGQLNKEMSARGLIGIEETFSMLEDLEIEQRWQVFGSAAARTVVNAIENQTCDTAGYRFVSLAYTGKFSSSFRILSKIWNHPHFWVRVAYHALSEWRLMPPVRCGIRPAARWALRVFPARLKRS